MSAYIIHVGREGSTDRPQRFEIRCDSFQEAVERALSATQPRVSAEALEIVSTAARSVLLKAPAAGVLVHVDGLTPGELGHPDERPEVDADPQLKRTRTWQSMGSPDLSRLDASWRAEATQVLEAHERLRAIVGATAAEGAGAAPDQSAATAVMSVGQALPALKPPAPAPSAAPRAAEVTATATATPAAPEAVGPEPELGALDTTSEDWLRPLLVRAMKAAHQLVACRRSLLLLPDRGRLKIEVAWGTDASELAGGRLEVEQAPGLPFFLQPSTLAYHGTGGVLRYKKGLFKKGEAMVRSLLSVPVLGAHGEVLAVMLLADRPGDDGFERSELEALVYLAGLVQRRIGERHEAMVAARQRAKAQRGRRGAPVPAHA